MPIRRAAASRIGGRAAIEVHFQPEALNEVLKGFCLKLTPMTSICAYKRIYLLQRFLEKVLHGKLLNLLSSICLFSKKTSNSKILNLDFAPTCNSVSVPVQNTPSGYILDTPRQNLHFFGCKGFLLR